MMFETTGDISSGLLKLHEGQQFRSAFASWPDGPVWLRVETGNVFRSRGQNRYWHVLVKALAAHCGCTHRQMHEALKIHLQPEPVVLRNATGGVLAAITIGGSTSRLTRREAANLIDRTVLLADLLGVPVTAAPRVTHFIPWDSPPIGRYQQRALCGILADVKAHQNDPSCAECRAKLAEDETRTWE